MNFNSPVFKPLRILLFPFSLIYGLIVWLRNRMYDNKIFRSANFDKPIICVGNLSAGGTGKSPMVEYLVKLLDGKTKPAIISRGYRRKTRGYVIATKDSTARDIGDEPMQFHIKFPEIAIAVGEQRKVAIPELLNDRPDTGVIILDDAFQHRSVDAGLNILLTDYNHLFTRDWFLPTGNLRDEKRSYHRAQIIIVTKCRSDLSEQEKNSLKSEISPRSSQHVFFTETIYGQPYHLLNANTTSLSKMVEVLLVTGIANPEPLKNYLAGAAGACHELIYNDHHMFSNDDLKEISNRFNKIVSQHKLIITTEKDAARLLKFTEHLKELPIYAVPIQSRFLFNGGNQFNNIITTFIGEFGK
ncbi:MAG TPA: tetraacyldisaccharide 4'-kinase [Flavitalea sp.]|nr:tetraacyldisaccharide 4'-kinase [Flavitalea sp.]